MSTTLHLALRVDDAATAPPLVTQIARALTAYAAALIDESMGGPVISGENKLEYGAIKMRIRIEKEDYEPQEG